MNDTFPTCNSCGAKALAYNLMTVYTAKGEGHYICLACKTSFTPEQTKEITAIYSMPKVKEAIQLLTSLGYTITSKSRERDDYIGRT